MDFWIGWFKPVRLAADVLPCVPFDKDKCLFQVYFAIQEGDQFVLSDHSHFLQCLSVSMFYKIAYLFQKAFCQHLLNTRIDSLV